MLASLKSKKLCESGYFETTTGSRMDQNKIKKFVFHATIKLEVVMCGLQKCFRLFHHVLIGVFCPFLTTLTQAADS